MKDFIGVYPKGVPDHFCDGLVKAFENQHIIHSERVDTQRQDTQVYLEGSFPDMATNFMGFVGNTLMEYIGKEIPFFKKSTFISSTTLLQKTEPLEGYHAWHAENTNWDFQSRSLAWMVYLNNVEEGGETEFLYQKKKFKPERGTILIWPGGLTHMHRGNPPMSTKYIATGWFQIDHGTIYNHILKRDNV
tara:strand:- start:42 stop:611 length:570 start_codon:yes stop_codon:yes gene_type:complete